METRVNKWASYRKEIYSNIELHNEVIKANQRLNTLYKRLLKVFPEYETLFKRETKTTIKFQEPEKAIEHSYETIEKLVDCIIPLEEVENFRYIEEMNFSTEELKSIIDDLKSYRDVRNESKVAFDSQDTEILIQVPKKVKLDSK